MFGFLPSLPVLKGTSAPPPPPSSAATAPKPADAGAGTATASAATATVIAESTDSSVTVLGNIDAAAVTAVIDEFVKRVDVAGLLSQCGVDLSVPVPDPVLTEAPAASAGASFRIEDISESPMKRAKLRCAHFYNRLSCSPPS